MKKIWNIIQTALTWGLIIITLCVVVITTISVRTVDARQRNIFGYKLMIVQSDSMSATDFNAGDLIIVKEVDPATLQEGDIISFVSRNSHNHGETVTHKIRSLTTDENGWSGFVTYGTTTDTDDEAVVRYSDVLGQYVTRIENMGVFFAFLRTPKGYITTILIPLLLMIFVSLFNCIRMFSGAQKQVEQEHQAAMEEERREKEQMRQELEELRVLVRKTAARQMQLQKMLIASGLLKPVSQKAPDSQKKADVAPQEKKQKSSEQPAQKEVPASVKQPETPEAPAKKEAPAPAKKQETTKAPGKEAVAPVEKPDAPQTTPKQDSAKPGEKKPGRFAAAPGQKKAGVQPESKPTTQPKRQEGHTELTLDNIRAEFQSKGNTKL